MDRRTSHQALRSNDRRESSRNTRYTENKKLHSAPQSSLIQHWSNVCGTIYSGQKIHKQNSGSSSDHQVWRKNCCEYEPRNTSNTKYTRNTRNTRKSRNSKNTKNSRSTKNTRNIKNTRALVKHGDGCIRTLWCFSACTLHTEGNMNRGI